MGREVSGSKKGLGKHEYRFCANECVDLEYVMNGLTIKSLINDELRKWREN